MKFKVQKVKTSKVEVEVDVEFPLYVKHDFCADESDKVSYLKIDLVCENVGKVCKTEVEIQFHPYTEIKIQKSEFFINEVADNNLDYTFGFGEYSSDKEEYRDHLLEVVCLMTKLVRD